MSASWPSLGGPALVKGAYAVAYQRPDGFYEPQLKGNSEFETLEAAIFGDCGALRILRGSYQPRKEPRPPSHVVIYRTDPEKRSVAIAIRPDRRSEEEFEAAIFPRERLSPTLFNKSFAPRRPGSVIEELWPDAVDYAVLRLGEPGSFPGAAREQQTGSEP